MKRYIFIFVSLILILSSCSSQENLIGVWINKELYDNWKSGIKDELVVPMEITVGNTIFIGFSHSITIDSGRFQVPGGVWKIDSVSIHNNATVISLISKSSNLDRGKVEVNFITNDIVYFSLVEATRGFKEEVDQSFLLFGEDNLYNRADRK